MFRDTKYRRILTVLFSALTLCTFWHSSVVYKAGNANLEIAISVNFLQCIKHKDRKQLLFAIVLRCSSVQGRQELLLVIYFISFFTADIKHREGCYTVNLCRTVNLYRIVNLHRTVNLCCTVNQHRAANLRNIENLRHTVNLGRSVNLHCTGIL